MSLYPFINSTAQYPIGDVSVERNPVDWDDISRIGLYLIDVIAPPDVFAPCLGFKTTDGRYDSCVQRID